MNVSEHPIDREEVMAYLDGELASPRAVVVAAHLEQCAGCRTLVADFREVSRQMAAWHVEPAPVTIDAVRRSALEQPAPPDGAESRVLRPVQWRVPRWALVSAGAAAVVALMVVTSTSRLPRSADAGFVRGPALQAESAASGRPNSSPTADLSRASEAEVRGSQSAPVTPAVGPMMVRTATLQVMVDDVEAARSRLDALLRERQGYMSELSAAGDATSGRSLTTTLRVPTPALDATLAAVRALGRVLVESQTAEDVLEQSVDLQARLSNARVTEQRLTQVLRERTGTVSDVLEVEREIARVRGEIERLDAQRKNLETRVALASVHLTLSEAPKASLTLGTLPTLARLRNAFVDGSRRAAASALAATIVLLQSGPTLLLWLAILAWPARLLWRRFSPAPAR